MADDGLERRTGERGICIGVEVLDASDKKTDKGGKRKEKEREKV